MLIPGVNFIVGIIVLHDLSKSFGKGVGMTLLNVFLPIVGYPVLAWGDAQYVGPSAQANAAVPPVQNTNNPPQTPAV